MTEYLSTIKYPCPSGEKCPFHSELPFKPLNAALTDVFGTNSSIRFSNVDGIVERKGRILLLEGKSLGVTLRRGQSIMFQQLTPKGSPHMAVVLWGIFSHYSFEPKKMQIFLNGCQSPIIETSVDDTLELVRNWARAAEGLT